MVPSCRRSQQNAHHGGAETLAECSDDRQHAGGIAGIFPRDVSEHFPIIGTLEAAKSNTAYQTAQTDIPHGRILRQRGQQDQPTDKDDKPEGRDERRGDRIRPATRVRRD